MTRKKYGLVLSGGVFNGAFQLGALNYLRENWHLIDSENEMHFDVITGISTGSLQGVCYAMKKYDDLDKLWQNVAQDGPQSVFSSIFFDFTGKSDNLKLKLDIDSIIADLDPVLKSIKFGPLQRFFMGLAGKKFIVKKLLESFKNTDLSSRKDEPKSALSKYLSKLKLAENDRLLKKLEEFVSITDIKDTDFLPGFLSLETGKYHSYTQHDFLSNDEFIKAILASTNIPVLFKPLDQVRLKKEIKKDPIKDLIDGGLKNRSPMGDMLRILEAKNADVDEDVEYTIIVINCHSIKEEPKPNVDWNPFNAGARALYDMALKEVFNTDIDQFLKINDIMIQLEHANIDTGINKLSYPDLAYKGGKYKAFNCLLVNPKTGVLGNPNNINQKLFDVRNNHGRQQMKLAIKAFSKLNSRRKMVFVDDEVNTLPAEN